MERLLLALNAGSSTLKWAAFADAEDLPEVARGIIEGTDPGRALADFEARLPGAEPAAVGHRVVHGGVRYAEPVVVDDGVRAELDALVPLDPLHLPPALSLLAAARRRLPGAVHVACFDTAFHRGRASAAETLAVPRALREAGLRSYGFHGLSYESAAASLAAHDPAAAAGGAVVLHLGTGASLCAMRAGRSVDTTMTFTALDGVVGATRPGSLDAGAILWLLARGWDRARLERLLWKECGLLGLSGRSGDLRDLLLDPSPAARLAVDVFVRSAVKHAAAMAAALGGIEALVFTGGVGENQREIRARIAEGLAFLGVALDPAANARNARTISREDARVSAFVLPADEERAIARHVRALASAGGAASAEVA